MKRSDEIAEALKTFFEKYECKMDADTKLIYAGAFAVGATWADEHPKNIWHDASEMPKEGEWILIQFDEDLYDTYLLRHFNADIFYAWCKKTNVIRWAYIDDLLPKGGGK